MESKPEKVNLFTRLIKGGHVPDILDCIANLSSDEVFTPPELVDKMLDLFPEDIWSNPDLKWLDPACKTGIFLRQIAKRLMVGLRDAYPDEAERREHIFHNMLYGIALTDLTALMSRRSLYTSKNANGEKSIAQFETAEGNISYDNRPHTYQNGTCIYCGNKEGSELDRDESRERHAYNFIHLKPEELRNMKFDVIVGNPPYQLSDGGFGASAMPIYQYFVWQAKRLNPRYMAFIIPSRWFTGGKGIDKFRDEMIADRHIKEMVDFPKSSDCFPGVEIKGGVCYFVRDREYSGECHFTIYDGQEVLSESTRFLDEGDAGVLIRYPEMVSILEKVKAKHEVTVDTIVSSQKPYGIRTDALKNPEKYDLPKLHKNKESVSGKVISIYGLLGGKRAVSYANYSELPLLPGGESIFKYKVFISAAYGGGELGEKIPSPVVAGPCDICTETFLRMGCWDDETYARNAVKYLNTKFFRLLASIKKTTQHSSKDTYSLIPLLNLNEEWTDEKLYARYDLTPEEIDFIESNIKES